jgi:ubiquinone/menaquinone biosynthesis C-methylase UbiE
MTRSNDPEVVRREYEREDGLVARGSIYRAVEGEDVRRTLIETMLPVLGSRALEVGCGTGWLAEALLARSACEYSALDTSERMVELTRARGVDAAVGDVQALDFPDGEFDCVIAAWMLYHVPDLDLGLSEVVRVLKPGGRLVAVTVGVRHLEEMWALVDAPGYKLAFNDQNGAEILRRHLGAVSERRVEGVVTFEDREAVQRYVASSVTRRHLGERVPALAGPLKATARTSIYVATRD